jgi:hypothetical protein
MCCKWTSPGWQVGRRGLGNVFGEHISYNSLADAFALSRKMLVSFVIPGRLSACNSVNPTDGLPGDLILETLRKSVANPDLVKIERKYRALHLKTKVRVTAAGHIKSP